MTTTPTTYDALLDEHEDAADLDCGCRLERGLIEGAWDAIALTWCERHRAIVPGAPEPDAEHDHADAARVALAAFCAVTGGELEADDAEDLIADLLHYLTREGYDGTEIRRALVRAETHFYEEQGEASR